MRLSLPSRRGLGAAVAATTVLLLILIVWPLRALWRSDSPLDATLVYYTPQRAEFPITVSERGNLESQRVTPIVCEVDSLRAAPGSRVRGTQILFIVPDGTPVREGDLLIELDSSPHRQRLEQELLDYQRAISQRLQSEAQYEQQLAQNEAAKSQAALDIQLAQLALDMYTDPETGTLKLASESIARQMDDARNEILEAQAALELQRTEHAGVKRLFELGYKGRAELEQSRFGFLRAEASLSAAVNKLRNHAASRDQLNTYQQEMEHLRLKGDLETATRNLQQVLVSNESALAQAEAALFEARSREERRQARVELFEEQVKLCKIYAPHDGMVIFPRPRNRVTSGTQIGEGAIVRRRQTLLTLPDLANMQIKTQIREATLDQVLPGQEVTVHVDAFPDRTYQGVVAEVDVLPTSTWYSTAKTYQCVIRIPEQVDQLKPGMATTVEIHVDRIPDALSVPMQAVVQNGAQTWCYVRDANGVQRRDVELGPSNEAFVQLVSGVEPGQHVVLNPMAIHDEQQARENELSPDPATPATSGRPAETIAQQEPSSRSHSRTDENHGIDTSPTPGEEDAVGG